MSILTVYYWEPMFLGQSLSALNATKRDLAEFVSVVQRDTSQAVSDAAVTIRGIVAPVSMGEGDR